MALSVIDQGSSTSHFTLAELKDLFTLDEITDCQTHDLLGCDCQGQGGSGDINPSRGLRTTEGAGDVVAIRGVQEGKDEDFRGVDMLPGLVKASQTGMVTREEVNHPQSFMKLVLSFHIPACTTGVVTLPLLVM